MSDVFKALGDPNRRRILEMLSEEGDLSAGDIASRFEISGPSVSHHLSILKKAGLVLDTRQGQTIMYSINTTVFQEGIKWLYNIFGEGGAKNEQENIPYPLDD